MPLFSIVIPVYNREREVPRAIQSCYVQSGVGFEVIVIDDGSTDESVAAIERCSRPGLKLARHSVNCGWGNARNSGVDSACGDWIVFLDSDDKLLPGALNQIRRKLDETGKDVQRLGFMYQRDDGRISPLPPLRDEIVDYAGYLRWLEGRTLAECVVPQHILAGHAGTDRLSACIAQ